MRRRNSRLGMIILLVIGAAVISLLIFIYVSSSNQNQQAQQLAQQAQNITVIKAKAAIPAFSILTIEDLTSEEIDASKISEADKADFVTQGSEVAGQMTIKPLAAGQAIRRSYLSPPGLSNIIPFATPGEGTPAPTPANVNRRAIALPVNDESGVGGQISNDDYIDIFWTQRYAIQVDEPQPVAPGSPPVAPTRKQYDLNSTKLILQSVHVIQVIQLPSPPPAGILPRHQLSPNETQLLILDVTPQEAEVIKYMRDNVAITGSGGAATITEQVGSGAMTLVLRARGDTKVDATTNTVGVTEQYMVETYGIKQPITLGTPISRP